MNSIIGLSNTKKRINFSTRVVLNVICNLYFNTNEVKFTHITGDNI